MSRTSGITAVLCAWVILLTPAAGSAGPDSGPADLTRLTAKLDAANRAYIDARSELNNSRRRQARLTAEWRALTPRYRALRAETVAVSVAAYQRGGGLRSVDTLLGSADPGVFADRVSLLEVLARRSGQRLGRLTVMRDRLDATKAAADAEVEGQRRQLAVMARQRAEVETALGEARNREARRGLVAAAATSGAGVPAADAVPAPHAADGSWPQEACDRPDPTTPGCLTPRTRHALEQARRVGFDHHVSCWRPPGEPYEHPKGRACDFAASRSGFGGVATGADLDYGTRLATWLVRNAERLGVMYVIWYHQIWTRAAGWHAYDSGAGDPSSDHTNHVHVSMY
jgi:hypothetical protein